MPQDKQGVAPTGVPAADINARCFAPSIPSNVEDDDEEEDEEGGDDNNENDEGHHPSKRRRIASHKQEKGDEEELRCQPEGSVAQQDAIGDTPSQDPILTTPMDVSAHYFKPDLGEPDD